MLKWVVRIIGGIFSLILLVCIGTFIAFKVWLNSYENTLEMESQVATTELGEIEYSIYGSGHPRLMLHGTPGGYEQVLITPKLRPEFFEGVEGIAVSRPGYLRTPLSSGKTIDEQADLFASLLDELGYDKVVVMASSGGGPFGLRMAIRHPEKVEALILLVPMLTAMEDDNWEPPSDFMLTIQDLSVFLLRKQLALQFIPSLDKDDSVQIDHAKAILLGNTPAQPRLDGQQNDVKQFASLDISSWPLEQVTTPTLFLHGTDDKNAPYEGSVTASDRMPNATLETFEGEDHFMVITRAEDINKRIETFLKMLQLDD